MKETYNIYLCHGYGNDDWSEPEFCKEIEDFDPEMAAENYIEIYDDECDVCKGTIYKVMVEDKAGNWTKIKVSGEATVNYYSEIVK